MTSKPLLAKVEAVVACWNIPQKVSGMTSEPLLTKAEAVVPGWSIPQKVAKIYDDLGPKKFALNYAVNAMKRKGTLKDENTEGDVGIFEHLNGKMCIYILLLTATELILMIGSYTWVDCVEDRLYLVYPHLMYLCSVFAFAMWFHIDRRAIPVVLLALNSVAKQTTMTSQDLFTIGPFDLSQSAFIRFCRVQSCANFVSFMTFAVSAGKAMAETSCNHREHDAWGSPDLNLGFGLSLFQIWFVGAFLALGKPFWPLVMIYRRRPKGPDVQQEVPCLQKIEYGTKRANSGLDLGKNFFGDLVFDGDILLMLSEATGMSFLQKVTLKYRRGRALMREAEMELREKQSLPEIYDEMPEEKKKEADANGGLHSIEGNASIEKWKETTNNGAIESQLDITNAMMTQVLLRFATLTILMCGVLLCIQTDLLMVRYALYSDMDRALAVSIGCTLFSGALAILDFLSAKDISNQTLESVEKHKIITKKACKSVWRLTLRKRVLWAFFWVLLAELFWSCAKVSLVLGIHLCNPGDVLTFGRCISISSV